MSVQSSDNQGNEGGGDEHPVPRPAPTDATNRQITLRDKGDILDMVAAAGTRQLHPMRGFDPDYTDIVDYIVRITHKIWEEKAIGLIYDTYGHNISVWTTDGEAKGREAVVEATVRSLASTPHVKIYVDEVIWSGNEDDGFHTSMRATSMRINTGYTIYGPPTGRRVFRRGIANCLVRENRIIEEWIAHDELYVIRQLGFDPFEQAARLARAEAMRGKPPVRGGGENERVIGQLVPRSLPPTPSSDFDMEDFIHRSTHDIWNRRMINTVDTYYSERFIGHVSSGKELFGRGDLKVHILDLLGAFPDAEMTVEHLYFMGNTRDGFRTSVRWSLTGTHGGYGIYGAPTGKPVRLLGISQHNIINGKITEEWTVFDEFALLKQLVVL